MKKQTFLLNLAVALACFTYLAAAPHRAYAGKEIVPGSSPDSASLIGDKEIVPGTGIDSTSSMGDIVPATGVNVQVVNDGNFSAGVLRVSPEVQNDLNAVLDHLLSTSLAKNKPSDSIEYILQGENNVDQVKSSIVSLEVSPSPVTSLVNALSELTGPDQNVDINKFNDALTAYNQIVQESSPVVLQALAKNPSFTAVNHLLSQLRVALNQK
ncbi:hypothetical protein [Anabaenopsis arnoldii]|uniref:Secreted protein n=1 Tax=Anabaenopsis arnoldii TaxID=2152938 RepID=A0ABT5AML4_9CYAN|nr:hypothetical protein [Anabaenopsis arnoldii]MDB9538553.1 hypothetical protein [Anabaenopsis arnoldii]MDH6090826.1 hypothetical protein [Anabaenopsis arnoldii]